MLFIIFCCFLLIFHQNVFLVVVSKFLRPVASCCMGFSGLSKIQGAFFAKRLPKEHQHKTLSEFR